AVEADALVEGVLQLCGGDRHRLQEAQDVGEPQPHETHVALLERAENEVFLFAHGSSLWVGLLQPDKVSGCLAMGSARCHAEVMSPNLRWNPMLHAQLSWHWEEIARPRLD